MERVHAPYHNEVMAEAGLSYRDLVTRFESGTFSPVYFLYGDEPFLIRELQDLLIEKALQPHERDFNLDIVYGSEASAPAVLALCNSYPMMAARRVVLVRQFELLAGRGGGGDDDDTGQRQSMSTSRAQANLFTEYAKQPNPTAVVVLACSKKPNLATNPYRALKTVAVSAELKRLTEREMGGWIARRVKESGRAIKPAALAMLVQLVDSSLSQVAAEVDKLVAYVGDRMSIVEDDVFEVGGHSREYNVFELQRTLFEGGYVPALLILERMLRLSGNRRGTALMIVSVLATYFLKLRKLAAVKGKDISEGEVAKVLGVPPFFLKEYRAALGRLGPGALERAFGALLAADFELKGGSERDDSLILTLLIRRLTSEVQA